MSTNIHGKISIVLLVITFLAGFSLFDISFSGPDEPVYYAYTQSMAEDGDLNIVNQLSPDGYPYYFPSGNILVSKTYNFPDYHNIGGIVFWILFYFYGESASMLFRFIDSTAMFSSWNSDDFIKLAMSFSTLIFGFFTIILTYVFSKSFFQKRIVKASTVAIVLGTPFYYFLLHDTANAQIIASVFAVLSIWMGSCMAKMKNYHWLLYGLFFSLCALIKVDLWFQAFFIISFFIILSASRKINPLSGLYFLAGTLPAIALRFINNYIKYGTIHQGELGLLNLRSFYFFEQLFSSYRGFIYTSPILYICLGGLILILIKSILSFSKDKRQESLENGFLFSISLYLIIKVLFLSFRYAWGGGTPGARLLLTEYPVFVLLFSFFLQSVWKRKILRNLIFILSIGCILWNMLVISEFILKVDIDYITGAPALLERIRVASPEFLKLFRPQYFLRKTLILFPVFLICVCSFSKLLLTISPRRYVAGGHFTGADRKVLGIIKWLVVYFYISYSAVAAANAMNNRPNVIKLKESGFFENARIVSPDHFEIIENVDSIDEMIEYFKLKGNGERVERLKKMKNQIYNRNIISQIPTRGLK